MISLVASLEDAAVPEPSCDENCRRMVRSQIAGRGITDPRILQVMSEVPRTGFVPEDLRREAYADHPVPIGFGQTISQPYIVAYMLEALALQPSDRVLEVGTGCGYQTALLAKLVRLVYTVEIIPALSVHAEALLSRLGLHNVHYRVGDGSLGWPEESPFQAIVVTAAPEDIPNALVEQLSEGGRLILPVGSTGSQRLVRLERRESMVYRRNLVPVRFVPLVHPEQ
jgi:protein-L-isoaspartate(D-aspartate) O-methyltransferase